VAGRQQAVDDVTADETRTARDQNLHKTTLPIKCMFNVVRWDSLEQL
jgi:hypothetical protein